MLRSRGYLIAIDNLTNCLRIAAIVTETRIARLPQPSDTYVLYSLPFVQASLKGDATVYASSPAIVTLLDNLWMTAPSGSEPVNRPSDISPSFRFLSLVPVHTLHIGHVAELFILLCMAEGFREQAQTHLIPARIRIDPSLDLNKLKPR